ncbi:MAG: ABC transporter substrate-binding protein [Pseudomonadales bacterium]
MMRLRGMILCFLLGCVMPLAHTLEPKSAAVEQAGLEAAAEHSVNAFHAALLSALRSDAPFATRLAILEPQVQAHFNLATIARLSLGTTWRGLNAAEQEQFRLALKDLISATYADRFADYSGQSFELVGVNPGRRGPVVRTQLVRQSGAPVRLDYHFRDGQIYNVVADGVSDLSLRRADYNSIVKQQGFAALLAHILDQYRALANSEPEERKAQTEELISKSAMEQKANGEARE